MADDDFAHFQFERIALGRYAVRGRVTIDGKSHIRRLEATTPLTGTPASEWLLIAQVRAEAAAAENKRSRFRKTKITDE